MAVRAISLERVCPLPISLDSKAHWVQFTAVRKVIRSWKRFRDFTHRLRPGIKIALLVIALLLVAGFIFRQPLRESYDSWQAARLVTEARALADQGRWKEVHQTAIESLKQQESLAAIRLLSEAAFEIDDPRRFTIALSLFSHPDVAPEDQLEALKKTLDGQALPIAARMVAGLSPDQQADPEVRFQMVRFFLGAGDVKKAIALTEEIPLADRDPKFDFLLAQALARIPDADLRQSAFDRMARLLGGEDRDLALGAMRLLASLPVPDSEKPEAEGPVAGYPDPALAEQALERFGDDDDLPPSDQLRLDLFRLRKDATRRSEIIEKAVEEYQSDHLDVLAAWLLALGEVNLVVELTEPEPLPEPEPAGIDEVDESSASGEIPEADPEVASTDEAGSDERSEADEAPKDEPVAKKEKVVPFPNAPGVAEFSPQLFQVRMKALERLGRMEQMAAEMAYAPEALPEVPILLTRAVVATTLDRKSEASRLWREAFQAAERDRVRNWFLEIVKAAARVRDQNRQMEAVARSIEHPRGFFPPPQMLGPFLTWLYTQDDPARFEGISAILLQKDPDNPIFRNNFLYFKALLGEPSSDDLASAAELVEKFPEETGYQGTLALLQLRLGDPEAALETLAQAAPTPAELSPTLAAIHAGALTDLGRDDDANAFAETIAWQQMPSSEARALQGLLPRKGKYPTEPAILNSFHYRTALYGIPTAEDLTSLRGLVEQFPGRNSYQGTLALAQLKAGDPEAAITTLEKIADEPLSLPPALAAIHAGALNALGQEDEAIALAEKIAWKEIPGFEADILKELVPGLELESKPEAAEEEVPDAEGEKEAEATEPEKNADPESGSESNDE